MTAIQLTIKQTQCKRIIDYLCVHGSINRLKASKKLGIFELSARICDLQRKGFAFNKKPFKGISEFGYPFHCVEYSLNKEAMGA